MLAAARPVRRQVVGRGPMSWPRALAGAAGRQISPPQKRMEQCRLSPARHAWLQSATRSSSASTTCSSICCAALRRRSAHPSSATQRPLYASLRSNLGGHVRRLTWSPGFSCLSAVFTKAQYRSLPSLGEGLRGGPAASFQGRAPFAASVIRCERRSNAHVCLVQRGGACCARRRGARLDRAVREGAEVLQVGPREVSTFFGPHKRAAMSKAQRRGPPHRAHLGTPIDVRG